MNKKSVLRLIEQIVMNGFKPLRSLRSPKSQPFFFIVLLVSTSIYIFIFLGQQSSSLMRIIEIVEARLVQLSVMFKNNQIDPPSGDVAFLVHYNMHGEKFL